jgi:hypothetical protein
MSLPPEDKLGFVQGLNNSAMNFGMVSKKKLAQASWVALFISHFCLIAFLLGQALAPWLFGVLADATSTNTSIIAAMGISVLAALINAPLMWHPQLGRVKEKPPKSKRPLSGEDQALVEKALNGEFIPPEDLWVINRTEALERTSMIIPKVKPYNEEATLGELLENAGETYEFRKMIDRMLFEIGNPKREKDLVEICELLNTALAGRQEDMDESREALGQWVGEYLMENGYEPHLSSVLIKTMMLSAFPTIRKEPGYTPENVEESLLRSRHVLNQYLDVYQKQSKYSVASTFAGVGAQRFYS